MPSVIVGWTRSRISPWRGWPLALAFLSACASPVSGHLPEGIYGSPDLGLRVDASGGAVFERSCGRGDLGVVDVIDGQITADFVWIVTGGDGPLDTAVVDGTPASLSATADTRHIDGTIESAGSTDEIHLSFGEEPTYFECP